MEFEQRCDVWKYFDNKKEEGYACCQLCKQRMKNNRTYCLRQHLKKVHNNNSKVWRYFDNIEGEGFAECRECKQRVRNNRRSNFTRHLEKYHNIIICDVETEPVRTKNKRIMAIEVATTVRERLENDNRLVSINHVKRENIKCCRFSGTQKMLDVSMSEKVVKSAIWGLLIDEGIVPPILDSKNMQSLIKPICDAISAQKKQEFKIDSSESERILYSVAEKLHKDFTKNLHWRLLSLKIDADMWESENTFCISVSFIDRASVKTAILGVIDLKDGNHLSGKHIKQVLHKFNIDSKQIIYVCWDNTKPHHRTFIKNSVYLQEIAKIEKCPAIYLGNIKIARYLGVTAQLCLLDVFKDSQIFKLFVNCRDLVKFISSKSNKFFEVFEKNKLKIPELDSPWKWGSTYEMIYNLQEAREILKGETYDKSMLLDEEFNVTDNFWLFVEAFCMSLKFIQKSITKYSTEEMHFGDWYAQWLKSTLLTRKLAANNNIENKYITLITNELLKSIEIRTSAILSDDVFLACLYMDPRFQHTLNLQQVFKSAEYLKNLWNRCKIYNPEIENVSTEFPEENVQSDTLNDDEDTFLNEFLCQDARKAASRTLEVYTKIDELKLPFKPVETNILWSWNQKKSYEPEISLLSEICFSIPTTRNYNKNEFSHIYQAANSPKIAPLTKENLLFVRLNRHLLDDITET